MSAEENKAYMRRFYDEVFNARNPARIDELIAADFVEHEAVPGLETPKSREDLKQEFAMFFAAFPDLRVTAEDMIAEGDKVAARYTMRGTHRGEFMGIPPTGKQITVAGMDIVRIAGGKAVEHWGAMDSLGLMQQLGAIPLPG